MLEDTINEMTDRFVAGMHSTLKKDQKIANSAVHADPSVQLLIHIISCTKKLKDLFEKQKGVESNTLSPHISTQLVQPAMNSLVASYGKIVMDSFIFEPKANVPLSLHTQLLSSYALLSKHILNLFPEMVKKAHKTSGKMLIHHCVFKSRPTIVEDSIQQILRIDPSSAHAADAGGALPLHWAVRNSEITVSAVDLLIRSHPQSPKVQDTKYGFMPLHWAVNQDHPNVEVVRRLLKLHPAATSSADLSGALPLHWCVDRDRPSLAVVKALLEGNDRGEAVKAQCSDEGFLPVHRLVNRESIDMEVLQVLVNYYPESLSVLSHSHQAPLHRALENRAAASSQGSGAGATAAASSEAIEYLLSACPSVVGVQGDVDGYLPLHLALDCPQPDYALAGRILAMYPQAAHYLSKESLLPIHVLLSANLDPPVAFVKALLDTYPQSLYHSVTDIVPAGGWDAMSGYGSSNIDIELMSGEWQERKWTPLSRVAERGLAEMTSLFRQTLAQLSTSSGQYISPVVFTDSKGVMHAQGPSSNAGSSVSSNQGMRQNSSPLRRVNSSSSSSSSSGSSNNQKHGTEATVMVDNFMRGNSSSSSSNNSNSNNPSTKNPVMKLPPNILRAQLSQSMRLQPGSSSGSIGSGSDPAGRSMQAGQGPGRFPSPTGGSASQTRALPTGPIPASLRQAAENNAMRQGHGQANAQQPGKGMFKRQGEGSGGEHVIDISGGSLPHIRSPVIGRRDEMV